jgi:hypothetical protein
MLAVTGMIALFAGWLYWLFQPIMIQNLGMAAYAPPPAAALVLPPSSPRALPIDSATALAAAEASPPAIAETPAAEAKPPEPKAKRDVQARARKPERPAPQARWDDGWNNGWQTDRGYAQQSYGRYERWF